MPGVMLFWVVFKISVLVLVNAESVVDVGYCDLCERFDIIV